MAPGQAAPQRGRFGDGEDWRMVLGTVRDPERIEALKQLFRGQRRGDHDRCTMRPEPGERKPCKARLGN